MTGRRVPPVSVPPAGPPTRWPPAYPPAVPPTRRFTQLPVAAALLTLLVGLGTVKLHHFRAGCYLVALAMVGAAALRLVLPARRAGLLVVRSRPLDVAVLATLGVAVLLLAKVVPAQ